MAAKNVPDIYLGPGDTRPVTRALLRDPDKSDGNKGDPMDLTNKTVVFEYQPWDGSVAAVTRNCTIVQSSPTVNRGFVDIDWLATGGAVVPTGTDFNARYIVTDPDTGRETFPGGPDRVLPSGRNESFLWLQVARDFAPVGP